MIDLVDLLEVAEGRVAVHCSCESEARELLYVLNSVCPEAFRNTDSDYIAISSYEKYHDRMIFAIYHHGKDKRIICASRVFYTSMGFRIVKLRELSAEFLQLSCCASDHQIGYLYESERSE